MNPGTHDVKKDIFHCITSYPAFFHNVILKQCSYGVHVLLSGYLLQNYAYKKNDNRISDGPKRKKLEDELTSSIRYS
jgi:hypothetical protein